MSNAMQLEQVPSKYIPFVTRPIEILAGSSVPLSCASTSVDETLASFTIAAGVLGENSILQIEPLWTFPSSANSKTLKIKIAGVTVYAATRTTSTREAPLFVLSNRNSLKSQIQPYDSGYAVAGSGTPQTFTIDFSVNVTVEIIGQRANAGEVLTLEYFRVLHFVSD